MPKIGFDRRRRDNGLAPVKQNVAGTAAESIGPKLIDDPSRLKRLRAKIDPAPAELEPDAVDFVDMMLRPQSTWSQAECRAYIDACNRGTFVSWR